MLQESNTRSTARRLAAGLVALSLTALGLTGAGCRRSKPPEPSPQPGVAQDAVDAAADTQVLHDAVDAANEVVRNAGDCDAAKAAIDTARRRLDEVQPRLRTGAARTSLANLRKQVDHVAELCP